MKTSETFAKIGHALCLAQSEMGAAMKDKENPHFKSRYADLAAVKAAINEPLVGNKIAYLQPVRTDFDTEGRLWVEVETILIHESGEWISETLRMPVREISPHAIGSVITYARRYSLSSFVALATEDDDGNAGTGLQQGGKLVPEQKLPKAPPRASKQLLSAATEAAEGGLAALHTYWKSIDQSDRDALSSNVAALKAIAKDADDAQTGNSDGGSDD